MIQELTDILSQIPEEQKQGLEASIKKLALTSESVVELKLGGGAFPDEGLFSIGAGLIIKNALPTEDGSLTLQDIVEKISKDLHGSAELIFGQFVEKASKPYTLEAVPLDFVDEHNAMLYLDITTPLKQQLHA